MNTTKNETDFGNFTVDVTSDALRIASLSYTFVAMVYLSYITLALVHYAAKHKYLLSRDKVKTRSEFPHIIMVFGVIMTFLYECTEIPLIRQRAEPFCQIYLKIRVVLSGLCLISVYLTLWLRVYIAFYINPVVKEVAGGIARAVILLAIVFLFVIVIVNYAVFLIFPSYKTEPFGCRLILDTERLVAKWILIATSKIVFECMILFSFIYPLYLNHRRMVNCTNGSLMSTIKRAAVIAGICMFSDTMNSIYGVVDNEPYTYDRHIVFSTNLIVNITAVIFSFADWRKRLFPFACCSSTEVKPNYVNRTLENTNRTAISNFKGSTNALTLESTI